jgi:hypothetical protein
MIFKFFSSGWISMVPKHSLLKYFTLTFTRHKSSKCEGSGPPLINGYQRWTRVRTLAACAYDPLLRALRAITMSPTRATMMMPRIAGEKSAKCWSLNLIIDPVSLSWNGFYCTCFWPRFDLSILRWLDSSSTILLSSFVIFYVALSSADSFSECLAPN